MINLFKMMYSDNFTIRELKNIYVKQGDRLIVYYMHNIQKRTFTADLTDNIIKLRRKL